MGWPNIEFRAPSLPSWQDVQRAAGTAVQGARELGDAAVSRAADLGQRGVDLGRRAIADPEGTVRAVAADVRQGINTGVAAAQGAVRDGVMAGGRAVGQAAELARDNVPGGDNIVSNAIRGGITQVENNTRFSLGVVGGVTNEVIGLGGTVATVATYGAELQVPPQARAELGQTIATGLQTGGQAVVDYGRAVATDPGRIVSDVQAGATTAWNATGGFVQGQVQRHQDAFARGEGFETLGMTTGQVATYVVPVGGGPLRGAVTATAGGVTRAAGTTVLREGAETLVRTGSQTLAREGGEAAVQQGVRSLTSETAEASLRAVGAETRAATLSATPAAREAAEAAGARLVSGAEAGGGTVRVARHGGVSAQDLAAASRQSGREVALYRDVASGERYVTFGTRAGVEVPGGSRLIAHTQPGTGAGALVPSAADQVALGRLGQRSSAIIDEAGAMARFHVDDAVRSAETRAIPGERVALEASRTPIAVSVEQAAVNQQRFADLAARRTERSLPVAGSTDDVSTVARLDINGSTHYGFNRGAQQPPTTINLDRVNPQTRTHAEADAVQQAVNAGVTGRGGRAEMWVDRPACAACGENGGLRSLARNLGVDELIVHGPEGSFRYTPTK